METSTATFFTDTWYKGTAQTYRAGETVDLQGGEFDGKFRSLRMSDNVAVTMWKKGIDSGGNGGETLFSVDMSNLDEGFRALRVLECGGVPLLIRFQAPRRKDGATPVVSFAGDFDTVHVPADGEYHRIDAVKPAGVSGKRKFRVEPGIIPAGATEPASDHQADGPVTAGVDFAFEEETHDAVFVWDSGKKTAVVSHWNPNDGNWSLSSAGTTEPKKTLDITSDGAGRFTVTPAA
ncbi:beta/gamma crystallin domain-containing protein [Streptomyces sp. NPDC008141]|uniref:beta/gamma crystallin domain-containing protein n=1 Tax=Streptomyces sp. NPDC008141 TaxID=3364815 RepID=UPI0036E705E5